MVLNASNNIGLLIINSSASDGKKYNILDLFNLIRTYKVIIVLKIEGYIEY